MIPSVESDLNIEFEYEEQPTNTFKLNVEKQIVNGNVDNLEAMKQAIFLILNIERYEHIIYSWDYGIELEDLFGKEINFVLPELKRRITEALTQDSRILSVDAFYFETKKGKVHVTFTANTIFGEIQAQKVVNI